jgi:hypothetical protein
VAQSLSQRRNLTCARRYEWYSAKDGELAMQFMLCVRQTVDAIEKSPLRFPIAVGDIRKAM